MKDAKMEELLCRFMDGETSVEDEATLANYFRNATDEDKPAGMPEEDWKAYREMFRQFDEGFDCGLNTTVPPGRRRRLWFYLSGAAAAAVIAMAIIIGAGEEETVPMVAEAPTADTIKDTAAPIDTVVKEDTSKPDTPQKAAPKKTAPKKQRRLPYTPAVPRNLLAQAAEANGVSEDSMAVALEETEHLIKAVTVYQEISINEICNVEFEEEEEEYYY